jgi:hypothetical protein
MDPISLAAGTLGAKFVEEAIKFLWSEASKILDRYQERRKNAAAEVPATLDDPAPAQLALPATRHIDFTAVGARQKELATLLGKLFPYERGHLTAEPGDAGLMTIITSMRALLGEIYHEPEALTLQARQEIERIAAGGLAIGNEASGVSEGRLQADQKAGQVEGTVIGNKLTN